MPKPGLDPKEMKRRVDVLHQCLREGFVPLGQGGGKSAVGEMCRRIGVNSGTITNMIRNGTMKVDWSQYKALEPKAAPIQPPAPSPKSVPIDQVIAALRKKPMTLPEIAAAAQITKGQAMDAIDAAHQSGLNIVEIDGRYSVEATPAPKSLDSSHAYTSRNDNHFVFGLTSDNHIGSKYERLDVLNDLYDRFAKAGVDRVFNSGNWIDGEAVFNKYDLKVHGIEPQLRYMAKHYPRRKGIVTYAVTGEDHEGWYARREAVNVGRLAERIMQEAGRDDWVDLGFMEAFVPFINANSGERAQALVMHPGGGSSYATSYRPQKIVESLEGGEKPAMIFIGHYHKLSMNLVRNVWALQVGTTQDQTPFMRKKNLEAHVGGMLCDAEQDPRTGAIVALKVEIMRYFNQGYYNDRWSNYDDVVLAARKPNSEPKHR